MSTESATPTEGVLDSGTEWLAGGISGVIAGIPFGLMIHFILGAIPAIGALYTVPGVATGWAAHLVHSFIFGLVFAVLTTTDVLSAVAESTPRSLAAGLVYGAVLWAVFIVFVWPVWLSAVGFPKAPTMPNVAVKPLVGHLVYGGVLGLAFPWLRRWL